MSTNEVDFIFLGDLSWFFGSSNPGNRVHLSFEDHQSVKHLIESLGIPHVEIGFVLANGEEIGLDRIPSTGDKIEVFPVEHGNPIDPRFMLDNHLGRLAALLRMLGFDCLYQNDFEDSQMAKLLELEQRLLLTRDRQLLMRKAVRFGYCLRSLKPEEQLQEVVRRFNLFSMIRPFTRCLRCNGLLLFVEKSEILDRLEPKTRLYYDKFSRCPDCGQIFWQGSHWEKMKKVVEKIILEDNKG
jgi:uncharacterized protein